jgi:hypothetical protein
MILETLLSGLGGGVLRLSPEVMKLVDRKNERAHELSLQAAQLELAKSQNASQLAVAQVGANTEQTVSYMNALKEAYAGQFKPTGIGWVDAASALVRPFWTYLVLLTWASIKIGDAAFVVYRGLPWENTRPVIWGPEDAAMLAMLSTFWFLDRVIAKSRA